MNCQVKAKKYQNCFVSSQAHVFVVLLHVSPKTVLQPVNAALGLHAPFDDAIMIHSEPFPIKFLID